MNRTRKILLGAIGLLILVGVCTAILGQGADDSAPPAAAPEATPTPDAEEAEDRRKGLHCLSDWDGDHEGLERLVRQELNDPDSMETRLDADHARPAGQWPACRPDGVHREESLRRSGAVPGGRPCRTRHVPGNARRHRVMRRWPVLLLKLAVLLGPPYVAAYLDGPDGVGGADSGRQRLRRRHDRRVGAGRETQRGRGRRGGRGDP